MERTAYELRRVWNDIRSGNKWTLKKRIKWLKALDRLIKKNKLELTEIVGKEKSTSSHEVLLNEYASIRMLIKEYIKTARKILGDEKRSRGFSLNWMNKKPVIKKEPYGTVGIISTYNHPYSLTKGPVISALLAGNAVLLKPAEETPSTNRFVERLIKESLAEFGVQDLFVMLPTDLETSMSLVDCELVDKIHFTGSVKAGRSVTEANAKKRFVPPTLELGGSNAAIVLEDANLKMAARVILWARFVQMSCNNIKRVFVVESVYDEFREELGEQFRGLKGWDMGRCPPKEASSYRRFMNDLRVKRDPYDKTRFLNQTDTPPIIIWMDEPRLDLLMLEEETFVPILPVVKVKDAEEAVQLANQTKFGLGASVFTKSKKLFNQLADKLECGGVYHNDAMTEFAQPQIPFGGWKESGHGYSHGPEGLLDFVHLKAIITERCGAPKLQLYPWTDSKKKFLSRWIDFIIRFS